MLDYLTRTDGSPGLYLLKAFATAIAGTIAVVLVASQFIAGPDDTPSDISPLTLAVVLLFVWPAMVTAMLQGLLFFARRLVPTYWHAAAASALLLALGLALLGGPQTGIVFAWPFFVYAVVFLAWQLQSNRLAWGMTLALQAMVNLPLVLFAH
ncbi:MAG: hypothetical protein R3C00_11590 [Hyphomonas sp.]|nr:hypothetical protein [Hyphomonas sp.]MCB9970501.1 hypothetical protein [Hyphomonas sp.]